MGRNMPHRSQQCVALLRIARSDGMPCNHRVGSRLQTIKELSGMSISNIACIYLGHGFAWATSLVWISPTGKWIKYFLFYSSLLNVQLLKATVTWMNEWMNEWNWNLICWRRICTKAIVSKTFLSRCSHCLILCE